MSAAAINCSTTTVSGSGRQQSRLLRRAPPSLQIIPPITSWNVAIPLLSPLAASPKVSDREEPPRQEQIKNIRAEPEKIVFKMWQHPASPFYYEPVVMPPFLPV